LPSRVPAMFRRSGPGITGYSSAASHLPGRHLDAVRGAVLAGIPAYGSSLLLGLVALPGKSRFSCWRRLVGWWRTEGAAIALSSPRDLCHVLAFVLSALTLLGHIKVWEIMVVPRAWVW